MKAQTYPFPNVPLTLILGSPMAGRSKTPMNFASPENFNRRLPNKFASGEELELLLLDRTGAVRLRSP